MAPFKSREITWLADEKGLPASSSIKIAKSSSTLMVYCFILPHFDSKIVILLLPSYGPL